MPTLRPDQWRALSPYLDEALEKTDDERAVWLSLLRAQNPDLASLLEELLDEHRELVDEGFMERRSIELPTAPMIAGKSLGLYRLVSQVGQGGMGTVWLAERNDGRFERCVAVKFLHIALVGRGGEKRFKREGRILGLLTHSHIAELIDAGVTSTGQPYLVLEYVEGDPIDHHCDHRKLNIHARLRLFLDVLGAVAHAHANLIVHRDLKPSNVFVRKDNQVKLLDFGIAKLLDGDGGKITQLTLDGGRALTPEYAAPEQLKGDAVTTATDVYALGVLLYLLLTGHHPAGSDVHGPAGMVRAIVDTEPVRPSEIVSSSRANLDDAKENAFLRASTPDRLRRVLRGDIDTIVATALKKEPSERYSSVTAFSDDIRRYLKNERIGARPDTLAYRAAKFTRRNRVVVSVAALAMFASIAGTAGTWMQGRAAHTQRDRALYHLARAERITELNEILLTDVAPMGKPLTVNQLLDREEKIVEREHYHDAASHVELLLSIGDQYSDEDENAKGLRVLEKGYQLSRRLKEPSTRAKASCALSGALVRIGELSRAELLFQEGLHEVPNERQFSSDRAFCYLRGSEAAHRNGDSKNAIARAQLAEQTLKESPVHSDLQDLNVLENLAGVYGDTGQFRESNVLFERASNLMTSLGYDETQKAVKLFNDWALIMMYAGRQVEAEKIYRRAIDISRTNQTEDAVSPVLLYNYAGVLSELGRFREAADYAGRASEKAKRVGDQMLIDQTDFQLARIYRDEHSFARADALLTGLEPRLRLKLPPAHYAFAFLTSERALLAQAAGEQSAALELSNRAVDEDEKSIRVAGQCATILPVLLTRRSSAELEAGLEKRAVADASRALGLLQAAMEPGTHSSYLGRAYMALAQALKLQGIDDEARKAFRSAAEHLEISLGRSNPDARRARELAESEQVGRGPTKGMTSNLDPPVAKQRSSRSGR